MRTIFQEVLKMIGFALSILGVVVVCVAGKRIIGLTKKVVNRVFDEIEKWV